MEIYKANSPCPECGKKSQRAGYDQVADLMWSECENHHRWTAYPNRENSAIRRKLIHCVNGLQEIVNTPMGHKEMARELLRQLAEM